MDLVSIEDANEWNFLRNNIYGSKSGNVREEFSELDPESHLFIAWTSGRLCDFDGCEKANHMKPINDKGWFWSANNKKMSSVTCANDNAACFHAWSDTGVLGLPQPDNRELRVDGLDGNESCMVVMEGNDGLKWHDKACYHRTHFVCEDNPQLLTYARQLQRNRCRGRRCAPIP
jgi:hypothetical protein